MVEGGAPASDSSVSVTDPTRAASLGKDGETLDTPRSIEATIESGGQGGAESTCNDNSNHAESGVITADEVCEKTLEFADELTERGSAALKENDFAEAIDCFSRALEIRVAHHGELAAECLNSYYQYGRALLYKAQEEADPLGDMAKKGAESRQESGKDGSVKNTANGESSTASVSSNVEQSGSSIAQDGAADDASGGKDRGEDGEDSGDEDLADADADEDESDLDLAWKMLDIARAIAEKQCIETMEKVDVLSALAEVALEREDIESSLSDYQKALSILEQLVEPDSRLIAELNFRICLCLEIGSRTQEAIPYCQKAISVCKARLQRLTDEVKSLSGSTTSSAVSEIDEGNQQPSSMSQGDKSVTDKESEITTLSGLAEELEKKLEDLQQLALNPKSILSELLATAAAKAKADEKVASSAAVSSSRLGLVDNNRDLDSPTVSTGHTNGSGGVTHLGVVGRGVKRVLMNTGTVQSNPAKKPTPESSDKRDGNAS